MPQIPQVIGHIDAQITSRVTLISNLMGTAAVPCHVSTTSKTYVISPPKLQRMMSKSRPLGVSISDAPHRIYGNLAEQRSRAIASGKQKPRRANVGAKTKGRPLGTRMITSAL